MAAIVTSILPGQLVAAPSVALDFRRGVKDAQIFRRQVDVDAVVETDAGASAILPVADFSWPGGCATFLFELWSGRLDELI